MQLFIDLRYVVPPIINLTLLLLTSRRGNIVFLPDIDSSMDQIQYPILETPIKLPVTAHPISVQAGHLSGPLALSLLASFLFPPQLLWVAYLNIIIFSPWHETLWNLFKCIFFWFCCTLRSLPPLFITCIQKQNNPGGEFARTEVQLVDVEGNHHIQNQRSLETPTAAAANN